MNLIYNMDHMRILGNKNSFFDRKLLILCFNDIFATRVSIDSLYCTQQNKNSDFSNVAIFGKLILHLLVLKAPIFTIMNDIWCMVYP